MAKRTQTEYMKNLLKETRKNVYKVNRNLKNIEQAGMAKASKAYDYIASRWAGREEFTIEKNDILQIRTDLKNMNRGELEHLNKEMKRFSEASTSTVAGTKRAYNKAYKSFKQNFSLDITYDEWKEIVEHKDFEENLRKFGSDRVLEVVRSYGVDVGLETMSESHDLSTIKSFNRKAEEIAEKNN